MSSVESPPHESDPPSRKKIQRRHGACEPCRSSKTKCDGRMPCGACRSERRRQCPCKYSEKAMKLQQVTAEIRRRAESEKKGNETASAQPPEDDGARLQNDHHRLHISTTPFNNIVEAPVSLHVPLRTEGEPIAEPTKTLSPLSVCAAIEEFKRLKPARGYSAQIVSRCNSFEAIETAITIERLRETVSSTAMDIATIMSTQASQSDCESMELRTLRVRMDTIDRLIKNGHLERAWVDLSSIIREIEYMSTRSSKDPTWSDYNTWNRLSNDVLDLEAQLALTIGRPTSLITTRHFRHPANNDVSPLKEETLRATRADLYQRIQGVLMIDLSSVTATRDFLEKSCEILEHDPFIQVGLCTTEDDSETAQDLKLNTHLLFMIIYCRMAGMCDLFSRDLTNSSWSNTPAAEIVRKMDLHQPRQKLNYCRKMFRSAGFVLDSFLSLHRTDVILSGKSWIRCHGAYVAAMILGIAKLRHEVEWHATSETLKRMEQKFSDCCKVYPECRMFRLAVDRLQDLNSVKEPASEAVRNKHIGVRCRKRSAPESVETSPNSANGKVATIQPQKPSVSPSTSFKRPIDLVDEPVVDDHTARERYLKDQNHEDRSNYPQHPEPSSSFTDLQLDQLSLFQDHSAAYGSQSAGSFTTNASVTSSVTSFTENDMTLQPIPEIPIGHPGPPFANPFPYDVLHPPMCWNNNVFTMDEQNAMALSLRIPNVAQFQQNASPVTCQTVSTPQYSLHPSEDSLSIEPTNVGSHQASPLTTARDRSTQIENGSSFQQPSATLQNLATNNIAMVDGTQAQVQTQSSNSFPTLVHSRDACRPSFDRRRSANDIRQTPPPGLGPLQSSPPGDWQVGPALGPRMLDVSSSVLGNGRGSATNGVRQPEFSRQLRTTQTPCYSDAANHQSQALLVPQAFPQDQMSFLNPAAGMFEHNQANAHYTTCQLPTFERPYQMQDSEQYQLQWRRVSIDAGGSGSTPY